MSKFLRISGYDVLKIIEENTSQNYHSGEWQDEDSHLAERIIKINPEELKDCHPEKLFIKFESGLSIDVQNLQPKLTAALRRTAVFANPKYFEMQRLRLSTWKIPAYIFCGQLSANRLRLPRGTIFQCQDLADSIGMLVEIEDLRIKLNPIDIRFGGNLSKDQSNCVNKMLKHELGVMVAPTGSGKTVMACKIIADRKKPTLIMVHRKQLIDQWIHQLITFLDIDKKDIGVLGGGRKKLKGTIDITMLQTLAKMDDLDEIHDQYEQIIIDECHHIPAFSFESVLSQFPARYVIGLTATPYRKDGHQSIIFMQCGPVRYELSEPKHLDVKRNVIIKETNFKLPANLEGQPPLHEIWNYLIEDGNRTHQIAADVIELLKQNRFPMILSDRKEHLFLIEKRIRELSRNINPKGIFFLGEMGKKARRSAIDEINNSISNKQPVYILSTGSLMGEGFDLPELDTLILAMPISFQGRVVQYAGRLHRKSINKSEVMIYDYLDTALGLTISMFKKRVKAYKKMED